MAVAQDGEAVVSGQALSTGLTLSSQTTAGTNRIGICGYRVANRSTVSVATWDGNNMTRIDHITQANTDTYADFYASPPTAASDVVITVGVSRQINAHSTGFNGSDGTVSGSGTTSGFTNSHNVDVSSASGDMACDTEGYETKVKSADASQTEFGKETAAGSAGCAGSYEAASGATVNMLWTSAGNGDYGQVYWNMPAGTQGGGPTTILPFMMAYEAG